MILIGHGARATVITTVSAYSSAADNREFRTMHRLSVNLHRGAKAVQVVLEQLVLKEIFLSQAQTGLTASSHLYVESKKVTLTEVENKMVVIETENSRAE